MDEITRFPAARLFKDGRIITIAQGTNKHRLPLFYALPKEIVSKAKEYLDFPRCPYDPIWTDKYDEQINDDLFLQLVMDSYTPLAVSGYAHSCRMIFTSFSKDSSSVVQV